MTLTALITALQQGDYDTVLVGTKYETRMVKFDRIQGLANLLQEGAEYDASEHGIEADAVQNAAKVIVLEQAVRELRKELEQIVDYEKYLPDNNHAASVMSLIAKDSLAATEGLVA